MDEMALEVKEVVLAILKSNPPQLAITAFGVVRTLGYTNPRLVPFVYIQPPPDGIYDFSFVATAPTGPVGEMISPVTALYIMDPMPSDLKGVRIHASTNQKEALLSNKDVCREIVFDL